MRQLVASLLLIIVAASSAVQLQHSISICCDDGAEHANAEGTCEAIDTKQIPDMGSLEEEDVKDCRIMMRTCCVKELQRNMCFDGLDRRANVGSCDPVMADGCASVEKTCCECCELGMKAFKESAPCEGTDLGIECDFAFRECCQRASSANDMDECSLAKERDHRLCTMKCVNLIGSYICECPPGFILASADNMTCIKETDNMNNPCESSHCDHRCQPVGNSFVCSCYEGYMLQADGYSCREEGPSTSQACIFSNCEYGCRPVGESSFECYCSQGYDLDADGMSCIDTNECDEVADICPPGQVCTNTQGSYRCFTAPSCSTGMTFNIASSRCEDIDECQEENVCPLHKICKNYIGGFYCQRTSCIEGEHVDEITRQCRDVDECAMGLHNCQEGFRCDNSPGSYRCTRISPCGTGYTVDAITQSCTDIDECLQDTDDCPPTFYCQNTVGSYKCKPCRQGYKADTSDGCTLDIDECEEQPDICGTSEECVNTMGSYRCNPKCPQGLRYHQIYQQCRDINECALGLDDCRPNQLCQNREGSYECICRNGMEFNQVTRDCDDIDECERDTHNCRYNEQCFNLDGTFTCQRRCQSNYRYDDSVGCVDINECEADVYPCLGNSECVNTPGSFRCRRCPRGQLANRAERRCADVDECKYQGLSCMGGCQNTFGSYMCTCPNGYELINRYSCRDIDECRRNIHNCSSQSACFNIKGGFKCKNIQCPQYFRKEINGEEVRCVKVSLCPNNDLACINDPVKLITYNKIALPSLTRQLREPLQLLNLQIPDLTASQADRLDFVLTQGNELGLFKVVKAARYSRASGRYVAVGTLYLQRSMSGPYETDLRLEMQLYNEAGDIVSITAAVFNVDVGGNPF